MSSIAANAQTRAILNCPAWCTGGHNVDVELGEDLVEHTREVWTGLTADGRAVSVDVTQVDSPSLGVREAARVYVSTEDPVDTTVALQMAAALMNAADIAVQANREPVG